MSSTKALAAMNEHNVPAGTICLLPPEILQIIAQFLTSISDLGVMMRVSSLMNECISRNEGIWRHFYRRNISICEPRNDYSHESWKERYRNAMNLQFDSDSKNKFLVLSNNNLTVTAHSFYGAIGFRAVQTKRGFSSGRHVFVFKIEKIRFSHFLVGLCSNGYAKTHDYSQFSEPGHITWSSSGNIYHGTIAVPSNICRFYSGDYIGFVLNATQHQVTLFRNGKVIATLKYNGHKQDDPQERGTARGEVCPTVILYEDGQSVTLLPFTSPEYKQQVRVLAQKYPSLICNGDGVPE